MALRGVASGGTDVGKIRIRLVAVGDDLSRSIDDELSKAERSSSGRIAGFAKKLGLAAGAAVGATVAKGVFDFTGFERQMNEVFTLLPGISQKAMDDMTGQVKNFSKEFGVLPDKVVPALYQSLSAGVPPDNVFAFLETAQKAARGGVTDLTTAVDGISSVVNAYGAEALGATEASDLMFTAVRLGKTNFQELSQSLFNVTPTAAALGVKFEDVTAALAAMTAQGVPTSVATTQMRQLFVELSKEGTKTSKIFEQIAGKSFKDFIAGGGNTQQALQLLEKHAADTGVGINDLFGSVEAGSAALSLTGQGTEAFSGALEQMRGSAGATDAAFQQMNKGIGPIFDRIRSNASVALLNVGKAVVDFGFKVAEGFKGAEGSADSFAGKIGSSLDTVVLWVQSRWPKVRDILVSGGQAAVSWFETNWPKISSTFQSVGQAIQAWLGFAQTVISVWVAVITDLWDRFGKNLLTHWQTTFGAVVQTLQGILNIIRGIFNVFAGIFTGDWSRVWEGIRQIFGGVWDVIVGVAKTAINAVSTVIGGTMAYISAAWGTAWNGIKSVVGGIWDGIKSVVGGAIGGVKTTVETVLGTIEGTWNRIWGGMRDGLGGVWDGIKGAVRGGINGLIDILNTLVRGANTLLRALPGSLSIPEIPRLQGGGEVPGWRQGWGRFQQGGKVPGVGSGDKVPILAEPGEFMVRKSRVQELGLGFMRWINGDVQGFQAGGLVDFAKKAVKSVTDNPVTDFVGKVVGEVGGLVGEIAKRGARVLFAPIKAAAKAAIEALLGNTTIERAIAGVGLKILDGVESLINKKEDERSATAAAAVAGAGGGPPGPGAGRGGLTAEATRLLDAVLARFPGQRFTSGFRTPAQNRAVGGSPTSDHMYGRAIDIAPGSNAVAVFARAWPTIKQVLWQVKGHFDHVHAATRFSKGGLVPFSIADHGTILQPGLNLLDNLTGAPEHLVPAGAGSMVLNIEAGAIVVNGTTDPRVAADEVRERLITLAEDMPRRRVLTR